MRGGDINFNAGVERESLWDAVFVESFFCCSGEKSLVGQGHVVEGLEGNAKGGGESLR